jgi:ribosome biogenesis protein Nip4
MNAKTMNIDEFLKPFGIKKKTDAQIVSRSYFIVKDKQFLGKNSAYSGECIAHIRGPVLIPSIDFLQQIGKEARRHVIINPKAEWLFICGRDIFAKGITAHNNPVVGDRVVILNQHKECLGYGDMTMPLTDTRVVIKRLFDIGDLLRRERKSRKVRQQ